MKEVLYEIIKEAENGKIIISNDEWNISFNTIIENNNTFINEENDITLIIKDENKTLELLNEYIELSLNNNKIPKYLNDKDKIKYLITYLIVNASTEDLRNINDYIKRRINFIKDKTFEMFTQSKKIPLVMNFSNSNLIIQKEENSPSMETPNRLKFKLALSDDENVFYNLPSVYYGIDNDTCYLYALLNEKEPKDINPMTKKYISKINRLLFKLNSDVKDLDDYKIDEEENIKDVSMSFVLALNIFISILQNKGIKKLKIIPYLPLRYNSRNQAAKESDNKEELQIRNDNIQYNLTNKLIRTIRRLSYQNKALEIENLPYEIDEFLTANINNRTNSLDNMLLEETNRKINNYKEGKTI